MASQEQKLLSKKYLNYIKNYPCSVCGQTPVDPHHMEAVGMGGANRDGLKDYSCVPLCRLHHGEYHSTGIHNFESRYKINLWKDAFNLIRRYLIGRTDIMG